MFLIMGINESKKELPFSEQNICENCGRLTRYDSFMTYMNFNLFFVPMLKWRYKCYVNTTCCGAVYEIAPELATAFRRGNVDHLEPKMMHLVHAGNFVHADHQNDTTKIDCQSCGYQASTEFVYCPKCGKPLRR